MSVIMQARSSTSGALVTWSASSPDWIGASFPGPGSPQEIAVAATHDSAGTAMHVDDDGIAHLDVNEVRSDLGTDCHVRSRLYRFTTTSDTPLTVDLVTYDSIPPKTFVRLDLVLIVRGAASDPQCGSFSIRALVKKDVSAAAVVHGGTDPAPYGGGGFPFDAQIVTDNGQQKIRLILTGDYITGGSVFFAELRMQMVDWT